MLSISLRLYRLGLFHAVSCIAVVGALLWGWEMRRVCILVGVNIYIYVVGLEEVVWSGEEDGVSVIVSSSAKSSDSNATLSE